MKENIHFKINQIKNQIHFIEHFRFKVLMFLCHAVDSIPDSFTLRSIFVRILQHLTRVEHQLQISNQFNLLNFKMGWNVSFLELFSAFVCTIGSDFDLTLAIWCLLLMWIRCEAASYGYSITFIELCRLPPPEKCVLFKWIKGSCHSIDITDIAIMSVETKANVVFYARVKWLSCYVVECDLVLWITQHHTIPKHRHKHTRTHAQFHLMCCPIVLLTLTLAFVRLNN